MHSFGLQPWVFNKTINAWKQSVFDCIVLARHVLTCIIKSSEFAKQSQESYACLILNDALTYATISKVIFTLICSPTLSTSTAPPAGQAENFVIMVACLAHSFVNTAMHFTQDLLASPELKPAKQ